jgi:hypothetical protein
MSVTMSADATLKRMAVRAACTDAATKGKLSIVSMMHGVPEEKLRLFVLGDDSALTECQIDWLAVDLRK